MNEQVSAMSEHILSLSYGKDSMACLGAIERLGWPLDRIIHADVWATDTIPADPPPMVEFKKRADVIIKRRWGITVEHIRHKMTYEEMFYRPICRGPKKGITKGFPLQKGNWCLKLKVSEKLSPKGSVSYIGIASDEPDRFHNLSTTRKSPLVATNWSEAMCHQWCEANGLLSPIYTTAARGGCWFCHNQGVEQLRLLRKNYPEYWALLLKWDNDSPVTFKADGHTVHDFECRFQLEDDRLLAADDRVFRWNMLDAELNYRIF